MGQGFGDISERIDLTSADVDVLVYDLTNLRYSVWSQIYISPPSGPPYLFRMSSVHALVELGPARGREKKLTIH